MQLLPRQTTFDEEEAALMKKWNALKNKA